MQEDKPRLRPATACLSRTQSTPSNTSGNWYFEACVKQCCLPDKFVSVKPAFILDDIGSAVRNQDHVAFSVLRVKPENTTVFVHRSDVVDGEHIAVVDKYDGFGNLISTQVTAIEDMRGQADSQEKEPE